jgi:hypothetical protein
MAFVSENKVARVIFAPTLFIIHQKSVRLYDTTIIDSRCSGRLKVQARKSRFHAYERLFF